MPGSVALASPSVVMPVFLSRSFRRRNAWLVVASEYPDGSTQRAALVTNGRNEWVRDGRISQAELTALLAFYDARKGGTEPFYFYDPWETSPIFASAPTGVPGRYTVVFNGPLEHSIDRGGRVEYSIGLREVI